MSQDVAVIICLFRVVVPSRNRQPCATELLARSACGQSTVLFPRRPSTLTPDLPPSFPIDGLVSAVSRRHGVQGSFERIQRKGKSVRKCVRKKNVLGVPLEEFLAVDSFGDSHLCLRAFFAQIDFR